jgi:single-stranded-DNA-specific exonuclease
LTIGHLFSKGKVKKSKIPQKIFLSKTLFFGHDERVISSAPQASFCSPLPVSLKGQTWVLETPSSRWVDHLTQHFALSPFVSQLLGTRSHTLEEAEAFLRPSLREHLTDPGFLPDVVSGVQCLEEAILAGKSMALWGDYDVDGATSAALWFRFLQALGVPLQIYIPDRFREGYGPNTAGLEKLAAQGVQTVIIVDCGTTAFGPLERAQELGLEVVVVDHHVPDGALPPCRALINPKRLDRLPQAQVFETLAAVGVSFFVIIALNRALRQKGFYTPTRPEPSLVNLLDLVALGTVCDVMPLRGLNRTLVSKGLEVMKRRGNLGLKTLMDVAGLQEPPSAYHLGFVLGPRINAGGRIGASSLGARLLTTNDPSEALEVAHQLDALNRERQAIEKNVEQEAMLQATFQGEHPCLVVSGEGWHEGILGIVASRLKERFFKPAIVIGWSAGEEDFGKASARSIPGLDMGALIHKAQARGHILQGGGHSMAGGLSLKKSQLGAFQDFVHHQIAQWMPELQAPCLTLGAALPFQALTPTFLTQLQALAPFGQGNPTPVWMFQDVSLTNVFRVGENHLRVELVQGDHVRHTAMAFRSVGTPLGDFFLQRSGEVFALAATLHKDTFKGGVSLYVEDVMPGFLAPR